MNKLISLSRGSFLAILMVFTGQAFAEYYVVRTVPPTVVVCNTCRTPVAHHTYKKHHTTYHRHHYRYKKPYKRHSSYSIAVYYPVVVSPCCGYAPTCNVSYCDVCNAGLCGRSDYNDYVIRSQTYSSYGDTNFDDDFDYDRRTADDVGADMDIDY